MEWAAQVALVLRVGLVVLAQGLNHRLACCISLFSYLFSLAYPRNIRQWQDF